MKRLLASMLLLGMASSAMAYEVFGNPDRKISFGVHYDHGWNNSEYRFGGFKINDFTEGKTDAFALDTRIPLSDAFTFSLRGGFSKTKTTSYVNEKIDVSDKSVGVSLRLYLP